MMAQLAYPLSLQRVEIEVSFQPGIPFIAPTYKALEDFFDSPAVSDGPGQLRHFSLNIEHTHYNEASEFGHFSATGSIRLRNSVFKFLSWHSKLHFLSFDIIAPYLGPLDGSMLKQIAACLPSIASLNLIVASWEPNNSADEIALIDLEHVIWLCENCPHLEVLTLDFVANRAITDMRRLRFPSDFPKPKIRKLILKRREYKWDEQLKSFCLDGRCFPNVIQLTI
ncbi:hypothetical protein BT63DRAFT_425252 [Microthyrium microscopicum]|uniref:Uncharacterized protein n=1 Tax=Microthyrium microscopicum TaxID=703497 RepID=A0A6A6UEM9_9PEZI|nr:hypothetical protein BT63DRAFT_425252 [Microthyrium microscopicum]